MTALLLLMVFAVPNPALTSGSTGPLSQQAICQRKWGLDRRHVTPAMRRAVFAAYGIPSSERKNYELDHLIPRELGGADVVANLWPQRWPEAHVKDREENRLHRVVCAGQMPLAIAQDQMRQWGRR